MSDERLRELERAARREGTVAARTAWLAERVRAGALTPAWLEAAAMLGDAAARKALGRFVPVLTAERLQALVDDCDVEGCARLAQALARASAREDAPALADGLEAVDAWLRAPGRATRVACQAALERLEPVRADDERQLELVRGDLRAVASQLEGLQLQVLGLALDDDAAPPSPDAVAALEEEHERLEQERARVSERLRARTHLTRALRCALASAAPTARLLLQDSLRELDAAAAREALVPWALAEGERDEPPAALRAPVAAPGEPADEHDGQAEFQAALEGREARARATDLRRRLRQKQLDRERVRLAALLGDPAAWLVIKPEDHVPPLSPPLTAAGMEAELARCIDPFARRLPPAERARLRAIVRARDPEGAPHEPGPVWPEWSRELFGRLCLAVGERALALLEAARADDPDRDPAPRRALEAATGFFTRDQPPAAEVEALARAAAPRSRSLAPAARAAAQAVAWACQLVVRSRDRARRPRLTYARQDPLGRALEAGLTRYELWALLRGVAIAWALREDTVGEAVRAYAPTERFAAGERLLHAKFGEGRVLRVGAGKVEVEFAGGVKTLAARTG